MTLKRGVFITGTDTGVGKTFAAAGITYVLRRNGISACSYKPVESGCGKKLISRDSGFVKWACGLEEDIENMNTYSLEREMSPHIAFEEEGVEFDIQRIKSDYEKLCERYESVVVEGCGGIEVPIKRGEFYVKDMIRELDLACIVVARAGIGTINHTILTVRSAQEAGIIVCGIIVNAYKGGNIQEDNIRTIESATGVNVIAKIENCPDMDDNRKIRETFEKCIDFELLEKAMRLKG